ncbi:TPA: hypothetical protein NHT88_003524 [Providencia rettgeri]|uniref:hypothetical protein n=1 Tax=Providencia TaxID=586 RepID=UPI002349FE73|nr:MULTISPECIES: hypothetical protein [unclassified Providencia]ELR5140231.1 hypothetical protein [Providencia rettgeri]HCH7937356.1 hypothetical protein [Providencia rettgeri]
MKDNEYADYMIFINALSDTDKFSAAEVKKLTGLKPRRIKTILIRLSAWGILFREEGRPIKYILSSTATDVIEMRRSQYLSDTEARRKRTHARYEAAKIAKEQKFDDLFICGMKVVEKANVSGMGSQFLKQLDNLLGGVRT